MDARCIAVIHGDPAVVEVLVELLSWNGYNPIVAGPGHWEPLLQHPPALVLLDLNLTGAVPDWSLLDQLREILPNPNVPLIALSTNTVGNGRIIAPGSLCRLVSLPCDLAEILSLIESTLGPAIVT